MRRLRPRLLVATLGLVPFLLGAATQDDAEVIQSILERIRSGDSEASTSARRELMRIDNSTITDEVLTVLTDAVLDSNTAVQEAVVWKLLNVRDADDQPILDGLYDVPAEVTKETRPRYPIAARQRRIQGRVILQFMVDSSGGVKNVRVLRSIPPLDEAATDCVRSWSFTPASRQGRSVPSIMTVPVDFFL